MYNEGDLAIIIDEIRKNIPEVSEIILFGSYATGNPNMDSDLDILTKVNRDIPRKEKLLLLNNLLLSFSRKHLDVDLIIKNNLEYDLLKSQFGSLCYEVENNGKTIWIKNPKTA